MVYIPRPIYAYYLSVLTMVTCYFSYYDPIKMDLQTSTKAAIYRASTNRYGTINGSPLSSNSSWNDQNGIVIVRLGQIFEIEPAF